MFWWKYPPYSLLDEQLFNEYIFGKTLHIAKRPAYTFLYDTGKGGNSDIHMRYWSLYWLVSNMQNEVFYPFIETSLLTKCRPVPVLSMHSPGIMDPRTIPIENGMWCVGLQLSDPGNAGHLSVGSWHEIGWDQFINISSTFLVFVALWIHLGLHSLGATPMVVVQNSCATLPHMCMLKNVIIRWREGYCLFAHCCYLDANDVLKGAVTKEQLTCVSSSSEWVLFV